MSETELVERLTEIIGWQARIIRELHSALKQLNAVSSIEGEIAALERAEEQIL